jgi:putative ATP-dependent endonuclease of OLD family
MYISKVIMKNFRLLKDITLDLEKEQKKKLSLLIGRNNSGKTSFIMLFDKFFRNDTVKFNFNDFSLCLREQILAIDEDTDVNELSIKMMLEIEYTKDDSLENISEFILDLDPQKNSVKILFECSINKKNLLKELALIEGKERFITKNISDYLETDIYVFEDYTDIETVNRNKLIKKELKTVKNLINFQVIHAKRDVASSEASAQDKKVLSTLTTQYFNKANKTSTEEFNKINAAILQMDGSLDANYQIYFDSFLKNSKEFLDDLADIKVVSDLQSKEIISNYSKIVYGSQDNYLPEHLNGLGYMNILYLLLKLEIKKSYFISDKRDINLLFIEEPEAHTHPQMQYVFANKIKTFLEGIENLQTIITTHSSHIVSQCQFEDLRYFKTITNNIEIKNFYKDLEGKYENEKDYFKFLKQYLTISSSELFFARKIIFIEGTAEKMLLPYFIKVVDKENESTPKYTPLSSQNISVLEVGANARAFNHFLEFLDIKTLIITDIDATKREEKTVAKKKTVTYKACEVSNADHSSNYTLSYFLNAPKPTDTLKYSEWLDKLKTHTLHKTCSITKIAYQKEENSYHARSFEDSFISINIDKIKTNRTDINGLKNKKKLDTETNYFKLTKSILKENGKSNFASSILFLALAKDAIKWEIPSYIKEGLVWISE